MRVLLSGIGLATFLATGAAACEISASERDLIEAEAAAAAAEFNAADHEAVASRFPVRIFERMSQANDMSPAEMQAAFVEGKRLLGRVPTETVEFDPAAATCGLTLNGDEFYLIPARFKKLHRGGKGDATEVDVLSLRQGDGLAMLPLWGVLWTMFFFDAYPEFQDAGLRTRSE